MAKERTPKPTAKQAAIRLLRSRALSKKQLIERLEAKDYDAPEIRAAVAALETMGVLSDRRLAESAAISAVSRSGSTASTRVKLVDKGVAGETAAKAVRAAEADDGRTDRQRAEDLARARLAGPLAGLDPSVQRRRIYALLARRGHDEETVESVVQSLIPEDGTDELPSDLGGADDGDQPQSPPLPAPRRRERR